MTKLTLPQLNRTLEVGPAQTLMSALIAHQVPVASSCKGDGICGKCKLRIYPEQGELEPASILELQTLKKAEALPEERLSCQVLCQRHMRVEATYW